MAKDKYIYDPESISYILVDNTFKAKVKKFIPYLSAGALVGIAFYVIAVLSNCTPTEKMQAQKLRDLIKRQSVFSERMNEADKVLSELEVMDDSVYRTLLGVEAIPVSQRIAGTGGVDVYEEMTNSNTPEEIINSFKKLDILVAKMNVQQASYKQLFKKAIVNVDRMQHLPAIIPISNWDLRRIGSGFSPRRFHPILKVWRQHKGIDFIAQKGTEIFAAADGVAVSVRVSSSFGNVVEIDHGYGIQTLYAHMSKFNIKNGQKIKRGQVIGYVGNSGLSAGSHLHYEVHVNGKEVDPVSYFFKDLSAQEYKEVVAQASSVETCMEG